MARFRRTKNSETAIAVDETKHANEMFTSTPIRKALLKMAMPSMVLMLVMGSYLFFDNVLSVNLAAHKYGDGVVGTTMVRYAMNGYSPINSLMVALALLIGMGVSTRVSINLGAKRKGRALNTIKTGTMVGVSIAIILTPILILIAKPWISSQYANVPAQMQTAITNNAFDYAWPVIMSFPFIMFNQVISSMLRVEARNKQMLIALVTPIFINLFMDWVMMGPCNMGVEGGAWATFISNLSTTLLLGFFILRTKKSLITFKNLFGLKFKIMSIVGILLVGVSPFLRNIGTTITQTTQMQTYQQVSAAVYGSSTSMITMSTGILPVFALFMPVLFAFAQAARPVAAFNFGAKDYGRVKQVYWWTLLYAFTAGVLIYFVVAWGLSGPLFDLLKVQDSNPANPANSKFVDVAHAHGFIKGIQDAAGMDVNNLPTGVTVAQVEQSKMMLTMYGDQFTAWDSVLNPVGAADPAAQANAIEALKNSFEFPAYTKSMDAIKIIMLALVGMSASMPAMVIFGSTDKIGLSILSTTMQGLILFWPVIFLMKHIAITNTGYEYWIWWMYPILMVSTSAVLTVMAGFTMHNLGRHGDSITLDQRITLIDNFIKNEDGYRAKRKVEKKEEKAQLKLKKQQYRANRKNA